MSRLTQRVQRIEETRPGSRWRTWQARPMDEWPDAALLDYLAHACGGPAAAQAYIAAVERQQQQETTAP